MFLCPSNDIIANGKSALPAALFLFFQKLKSCKLQWNSSYMPFPKAAAGKCRAAEETQYFSRYATTLMYKFSLLFYGIAHIAAGVVIALFPSITSYALTSSISSGTGVLLGFISTLAGLGFTGCAFVRDTPTQLLITRLCLIGNVLNFVAHAVNAIRGDAPMYMLYFAGVAIGSMFLVLLAIEKKLRALQGVS